MSKAEDLALEKYPWRSVLVVPARGGGYYADSHLREGFIEGYRQAEKDVAEAFARIVRGNLSMIDKSVQNKFKQLYTDITGEKMYKGFKDWFI